MTIKNTPKMYEVYAALDVLDRCTDSQFNRALETPPLNGRGRSARSRALNAYKGSTVQKAQRKPKPTGEGWDPDHQIIITLGTPARKGKSARNHKESK